MKLVKLPVSALLLIAPAVTTALAQNSGEASSPAAIRQRMEASIDRQMNSIAAMNKAAARTRDVAASHQRPAASGFFDLPALPVTPRVSMPVCDPLPAGKIDSLVNSAAAATTVDPGLIRQVMRQESADYPCAVSGKGAMGLMQLMPSTAAAFGVEDAFAPEDNVVAGAKLLRQLIDHYSGNLSLVLGAYNPGEGVVDANMSVPDFPETTDYVHQILSRLLPGHDLQQEPSDQARAIEAVAGTESPGGGAAGKEVPEGIH